MDQNIKQLENALHLNKEPSFNNLANRSDTRPQVIQNYKINSLHNKAMNTFSSMDWSPYTTNTASRSYESIFKESEAEFKRKGDFIMLFPSPLAPVNIYKNLFVNHTNSN